MSVKIRKILAPITLAILLEAFFIVYKMLLPYILFSEEWYTVAMTSTAIISVVIANKVWPSSLFTVAVVLLFVLIIRESGESINLAFFISWYAGVSFWEAFLEVADDFALELLEKWYRISLPLFAGIGVSFAFKHLTRRSSRDRANRAAP